MERDYVQTAKVFKALCDERRLRILDLLKSGEKCACVLTEQMVRKENGRITKYAAPEVSERLTC